jgi:competence protein ComEC
MYRALYSRLLEEHDRYVLWAPLGVALGTYGYVALSLEPRTVVYSAVLALLFFTLVTLCMLRQLFARALGWAIVCGSIGFLNIAWKTHQHRDVLLKKELGPFWMKGTVVALDHTASTSGKIYPRVWVRDLSSRKGPMSLSCVRLGIKTACSTPIVQGDTIEGSVKLIPWKPPIAPGGYDAQFQQFFQGVSGYGFVVSKVVVTPGKRSTLIQLRQYLTRSFHQHLPYPLGAVAGALITGDKTALPALLRQEFSVSGLSHILAISGLHLSIVSGICFFLFQMILRCVPQLALVARVQTVSGVCALGVGVLYAYISGMGYPVQRSFALMAAGLFGVLFHRKPLSARLLSLCAVGILLMEPHACFSLSFQLSFIATASLMTLPSFSFKMRHFNVQRRFSWLNGWWKTFTMMNMTTLAATFSTVPLIAYYFQQYSVQSVISNLFAVSWTSFCVMPLGLIALASLLTPYAKTVFLIWGISLKGLVWIAHASAHYLDFLLFPCPAYGAWIYCGQMIAMFWWLIWKGTWRWWGVCVVIALGVVGWFSASKPELLTSFQGDTVGVVDWKQRLLWMSYIRREKYAIQQWVNRLGLGGAEDAQDAIDPLIIQRIQTARSLKQQYPGATSFYRENDDWFPVRLLDMGRPWRIQQQPESKKDGFKQKKAPLLRRSQELTIIEQSRYNAIDINNL